MAIDEHTIQPLSVGTWDAFAGPGEQRRTPHGRPDVDTATTTRHGRSR